MLVPASVCDCHNTRTLPQWDLIGCFGSSCLDLYVLFPWRLYNHWPGTQRKALIEFVHCKVAVLESTSQEFLAISYYTFLYMYMHIYIYISWLFGDTAMFFGESTYCISEFDEVTLYRIWHVQKHVQILMGGFNLPLKNMSSSVGSILPNIWKVIKFHGSKSPTSYDIPFIMVIHKSL